MAEIYALLDVNALSVVETIKFYDTVSDKTYLTTPGRLILGMGKPRLSNELILDLDIKKGITVKELNQLIHSFGPTREKVQFVDAITKLTKYAVTEANYSALLSEVEPIDTTPYIESAKQQIADYRVLMIEGFIPNTDSAVVNIWRNTIDKLGKDIKESFSENSSLYHIIKSGARGNFDQVRQMKGLGGLVVNIDDKVLPVPITSSFAHGLNQIEMLIENESAYKGLVSLSKTITEPGELTRSLVYLVNSISVVEDDCGYYHTFELEYNEQGFLKPLLVELFKNKRLPDDTELPCNTQPNGRKYFDSSTLQYIESNRLKR